MKMLNLLESLSQRSSVCKVLAAAQKAVVFLDAPENRVLQALMQGEEREALLEAQQEFQDAQGDARAATALLERVHALAVTHLADHYMTGPEGFLRSAEAGECVVMLGEMVAGAS